MRKLVGQDLVGWRIEIWYELRLSVDERGGGKVGGYFTDKTLALAAGKGEGWYGSDGTVSQVLVLTRDNKTGYLVKGDQISLSDQDDLRAKAVSAAKSKLSPEERDLLGL